MGNERSHFCGTNNRGNSNRICIVYKALVLLLRLLAGTTELQKDTAICSMHFRVLLATTDLTQYTSTPPPLNQN